MNSPELPYLPPLDTKDQGSGSLMQINERALHPSQQILSIVHQFSVAENKIRVIGEGNRFLLTITTSRGVLDISYGTTYFYEANVEKNGSLEISTVLVRNQQRHPYFPHFKDLFPATLSFFNKQSLHPTQIYAVWSPNFGDTPNINLEIYHQNLLQGNTPENSALLTPLGRVISKFGFSVPTLLSSQPMTPEGVVFKFTKSTR